ncbi:hypothetical protein [Desulfopila sp. IMCC35008]|uniref:hypothetical protein n=1 Tax=Desulfopila sp. IMCC35008 TaxID=2653858 RepID=UPI0013D72FDE|nr:hypothetical protein [Desulfopila sp. IMCC35008]
MEKLRTITVQNAITVITFHKKPILDEFCRTVDSVVQAGQPPARLWDLSCGLELTPSELISLASYARCRFHQSSRAAIVAPDDLTFGLFRLLDVYRDDGAVQQVIFRSKPEAVAWLSKL